MLWEISRVAKLSGVVAIVDEAEHSDSWISEEHANIRLGFEKGRSNASSRSRG